MVEKYLSLPLFLSFLPFLYLVQSVPFCTKAGGLVMMRGIIYTNLINIIFPSSFIFLLSPSTVCCLHAPRRPQLSSLPNIHLSKVSTCWCAIKNWPSVSCFNRAAFLCHASPIKPQRAKNIPLGCFFFLPFFLSRKSQRMAHAHKCNTTQLSAMCELDSVAPHHKATSGRHRLAQRMLSI